MERPVENYWFYSNARKIKEKQGVTNHAFGGVTG